MLTRRGRRRTGRRIQPRVRRPAAPVRSWQDRSSRTRAAPNATPRCNPDSTPGISPPPPPSRHRSAALSWKGWPPSAHGGGGSSRRASPTTETTPPGAPNDRDQHPPRQATPAGREQPAREQVICADGAANTYRMSRHSYSAVWCRSWPGLYPRSCYAPWAGYECHRAPTAVGSVMLPAVSWSKSAGIHPRPHGSDVRRPADTGDGPVCSGPCRRIPGRLALPAGTCPGVGSKVPGGLRREQEPCTSTRSWKYARRCSAGR